MSQLLHAQAYIHTSVVNSYEAKHAKCAGHMFTRTMYLSAMSTINPVVDIFFVLAKGNPGDMYKTIVVDLYPNFLP